MFTWPVIDDIQQVFTTQVMCKIEPPQCGKTKATKSTFQFTAAVYKTLNETAKTCEIYEI